MVVQSRGDLASRHGSIGRVAVAHSWSSLRQSYLHQNPRVMGDNVYVLLVIADGRRAMQALLQRRLLLA